jgi:histidyl-tRNA synthetase
MASAKGYEYYTGVVFQFFLEGRKIGGGGRYNDLVPLLGGGNVPASGFALYIDQLMKDLPTKNWEDTRQSVLVKGNIDSAEKCKLSFELASLLRGVGYIVDLDQNNTRTNDYRWVLMIQGEEKPSIVLADQVSGKSIRADSPTEILNVLQEKKVNEASSS